MVNAGKIIQSSSGAGRIDVHSCTEAVQKLDAAQRAVEAVGLCKDSPTMAAAGDLRQRLQVCIQAFLDHMCRNTIYHCQHLYSFCDVNICHHWSSRGVRYYTLCTRFIACAFSFQML